MKDFNSIKKTVASLTDTERQKFKDLSKELSTFSEKKEVEVMGLKTLFNLQTQINSLIEQYSDRVIRLLKQNHMLN